MASAEIKAARRARRRAEIIGVAREIVAKEGLDAMTISAIESRVAFTRGVITYHFENKDDIVMAVLESALAEIDEATDAAANKVQGSFRDLLHTVISGMAQGFIDHDEAGQILLAFWGSADPRAARVNATLYARYRAQSAQFLTDLGFTNIDVDAYGGVMVGGVLGIVLQHMFEPGAINPDALIEAHVDMLHTRLVQAAAEIAG